jgi:hypothetical protein
MAGAGTTTTCTGERPSTRWDCTYSERYRPLNPALLPPVRVLALEMAERDMTDETKQIPSPSHHTGQPPSSHWASWQQARRRGRTLERFPATCRAADSLRRELVAG